MARSTLANTRRAVAVALSAALVLAATLAAGTSAIPTAAPFVSAPGPVRFAPISMTPAALTSKGSGAVMGANSNNWAGWAASGNRYTSVNASWTQPSVQCAKRETSDSAFWVGLDGYNSGSVEQIGVQAGCSGGNAFYGGWTELYPAPAQNISQTIGPGDAMSVSAALTGGHSFRLTITDATRHWTVQSNGSAPHSSNVSAEVVTEAPTDGKTGRVMQLSNFRSVSFANAAVNGRPMSQASQLHQVTMGSSKRVMASPTGFSGTSFGVSWRSASG